MAKVLWTQKQDVGPSARGEHAIAYDEARERTVLFGGRAGGGSLQGDSWEWDGTDWTEVADTGPDARSGHALAFDAARERVVLFGGEAAGSALRGDTWEWDGTDWTEVADTGPDARSGHALAFDAARERVVLFGGEAAGSALRGDTWEWDGTDWTEVADTGPDARSGHALAFDAARERVVLFGGEAAGSALRGDTWEWDGKEWTEVAHFGPGPSAAFAMTFVGGATLLFGGVTSSTAPAPAEELSRLSWEWDGAHWTLRQDMGPTPRWGHAIAFDSVRGRPVLFGGFSALPADPGVADSVLADTWDAEVEEIPVDGPRLASFALNPETESPLRITLVGGPTTSLVATRIEVGLDRPAPVGGIQVAIVRAGRVEPSVVVAEGAMTGWRFWSSKTVGLGDQRFRARFGGVTLTAVLHVV